MTETSRNELSPSPNQERLRCVGSFRLTYLLKRPEFMNFFPMSSSSMAAPAFWSAVTASVRVEWGLPCLLDLNGSGKYCTVQDRMSVLLADGNYRLLWVSSRPEDQQGFRTESLCTKVGSEEGQPTSLCCTGMRCT